MGNNHDLKYLSGIVLFSMVLVLFVSSALDSGFFYDSGFLYDNVGFASRTARFFSLGVPFNTDIQARFLIYNAPMSYDKVGKFAYSPVADSGSFEVTFSVPEAGFYVLRVEVMTPGVASEHDSFYVGVDGQNVAGNLNYVFDVQESSVFSFDYVNYVNPLDLDVVPQDPAVFNLTAGNHRFTFYTRESGVRVKSLRLIKYVPSTYSCIDDDADGFYAIGSCSGDDCDDTNPSVHALITCVYNGYSCGQYSICAGSCILPPEESCDTSFDDDCDGLSNEDCVPVCLPIECAAPPVGCFWTGGVDSFGCPVCGSLICGNECVDVDGDGYFAVSDSCVSGDDCDDSDALINPGVVDVCGDGFDQDCDGFDLVCAFVCDVDGDGFNGAYPTCQDPADCDDSDPLVFPGAEEICSNNVDEDCDSFADEECYNEPGYVVDASSGMLTSPMISDNSFVYTPMNLNGSARYRFNIREEADYFLEVIIYAQSQTSNSFFVGLSSDNVIGNAWFIYDAAVGNEAVYDNVSIRGSLGNFTYSQYDPKVWHLSPGYYDFVFYGRESYTKLRSLVLKKYLPRVCEALSCATPPPGCYWSGGFDVYGCPVCGELVCEIVECVDVDGDGYFAVSDSCVSGDDCDDSDALINPGVVDVCGDGVDQDCDGFDLVCAFVCDVDGDGFNGAYPTCQDPADCDDSDINVNPLVFEGVVTGYAVNCDGRDNNCNGLVDENSTINASDYVDVDGDGFYVVYGSRVFCVGYSPEVPLLGDCDDSDALINPNSLEVCGDGVDQDCSGVDLTCPPASNRLIVGLSLDDNVLDDSGNNNHAMNYGATFAQGRKNSAAFFSGGGQYINIPYTSSLPSGTIAFWLKTNSAYNDFQIYIEGDGTEPNGYSSPGFEGTASQLKFYVSNVCELSSGILSDTWVHVVGTWDGVQNGLYVNGYPVASGVCPYGETGFSRFSIGGRDASYSFNGAMDEVKIYNYALGSDDVLTLYNSYSSPPSCSDGIQNQGETGIDCGGPCPACQAPTMKVLIRGIMFGLDDTDVTPEFLNFIRTTLKQEGVNTIVFRIEYNYKFTSHPEITENSLSYDKVKQVVAACRDANIKCIPQFSVFGHQSYDSSEERKALLRTHPEFDANPNVPVLYSRSWNPYYPGLQSIVNDLVDELVDVWETDTIHIGMDEIWMMPTSGTPYYNGQSRAEMFAYQFEQIRQHMTARGVKVWVWGDRLLDGSYWNIGSWEGDTLGTHTAINSISPQNVLITDWHYDSAPATAQYFAGKGFDVVSAPWENDYVALAQLNMHLNAAPSIAPHMKGMLLTTWRDPTEFMNAYNYGSQVDCDVHNCATGGGGDEVCINGYCFDMIAYRVANVFKQLMSAIRSTDPIINNTVCNSGQSRSCPSGLPGICSDGTQYCSNNAWGICNANVLPGSQTEVCNDRLDNNCNGLADENCAETGNTYYVSSSTGNDDNTGTSISSPWKSLSKVNSRTFAPGDQILFKRGDVWNEELHIVNQNGAPGNYITFGAYGSGEKPLITSMQRVPGSNDPGRWTRLDNNVYEMQLNPGELPILSYDSEGYSYSRLFRLWFNGQEYCRAWDRDLIGVDNKPYAKSFWEVVQPGEWNNWPDSTYIWQFPRESGWSWSKPTLRVYSPNGNNPASVFSRIEYSLAPRRPAIFQVSSYFIIDNLDIRGGYDGVLWIEACHDVIVKNSNIGKDSTRSGIRFVSGFEWDWRGQAGYNFELKNNVIDKGDFPYCPTRPDTSSEGIDITWNVYNVSIHDNIVKGWSSAAFRVLGVKEYASLGPRYVYFYNNFVDGSSQRYARPFNIAGDSSLAQEIDTTPEHIYIYNNYITNVSTRSQVAARDLNIHHNVWNTVGSRPIGLKVMHHDDDSATNFYTNQTEWGVGSWGVVDVLSQAMTIGGVGSELNPSVRVFNNIFYDLNAPAFYQDFNVDNTIFANNLIINAAKYRTAFDSYGNYRLVIQLPLVANLNRQFLNNYVWINKTAYPSYQDKYIGYGTRYPEYLMTIDQWNLADGTSGDIIRGNRMLNGTMASVINPGLTLPASSPARNAGVDISAWVPSGFRDMNGVIVDLANPDIGAFEYSSTQINNTVCIPGTTQSCTISTNTYVYPSYITINASASDSDGIARVEFYADDTLIGTDTTYPYSYIWKTASPGTHIIYVKAFDNLGASTTSSTVTVLVVQSEYCGDGSCNNGETCTSCAGDCGICQIATCHDGVQNQGETGIDCGGPCPACYVQPYCTDGTCNNGENYLTCPQDCPPPTATCYDGMKNQNELGIDCGGVCPACSSSNTSTILPVRGLMLHIGPGDVNTEFLDFIRNDLKQEGVNTLVFGVNYGYQFTSHPEVSNTGLSYAQVRQVVSACNDVGIKCIPYMQLLGHQSCYGTDELLNAYPYLDANPASSTKPAKPTARDYCRSWNSYHPELHPIVFDLVDEMIDAWDATDFHIGMDEIFMLPELETSSYAGTPYYNGQSWSEVFRYEYETLRSHLAQHGVTMWLWGDRLLNSSQWLINDWESDGGRGNYAIHPAINTVSRQNVIINDWHYTDTPATADYFASKGFDVVSSPLDNPYVALWQLDKQLNAPASLAPHMKGMLQTTWRGGSEFMYAYKYGQYVTPPADPSQEVCYNGYCFDGNALNAANTFKQLMSAIRTAVPETPPNINGEQKIFTTQSPTSFGGDARYELGVRFKTNANGHVTKVRIYTSASESGDHIIRLWRAPDSTVIAGPYTWTITSGTAGWKEYTLPSPVAIESGMEYILSVSNSADKIYAIARDAFGVSATHGNILTFAGSGTYTTQLGAMPTSVVQNSNYFRDIVFVSSGGTNQMQFSAPQPIMNPVVNQKITSVSPITGFVTSSNSAGPTCSDGIQNQAETGIDCGGPCMGCSNFSSSRWQQIGPGAGKNEWYRSVRFNPNDPSIVYLAADANGGFSKSYDGGMTWYARNDGLNNLHLEDIAVSGNNVIVASLGGVYKSSNAGETWQYKWQNIAGPLTRTGLDNQLGWISAVHVSPKNPQLMFAGSGGHHPQWSHPSIFNIYRSTDGGETWHVVSNGSTNGIVHSDVYDGSADNGIPEYDVVLSISSDPNNSNIVFVSTRKRIFKSIDAGQSWTKVLNNGSWYVAVDPKNSNVIFASLFGPTQNVYKSTNGGASWVKASVGIASDAIVEEIRFDPLDASKIYAGVRNKNSNQIYRSIDGGDSWTSIMPPGVPKSHDGDEASVFAAYSIDVYNGRIIKAPAIYLSLNDGQSWQNVHSTNMGNGYWKGKGLELMCVHDIAVHPTISGKIYMGMYDSGVWVSQNYGDSWKHLDDSKKLYTAKTDANGDPYTTAAAKYIAVDKTNPLVIYAGMTHTNNGKDLNGKTIGLLAKSTDGGITWDEVRSNLPEYRIENILSLSNGVLFVYESGDGLWKSVDSGNTWNRSYLSTSSSGIILPDPRNESILYLALKDRGLYKLIMGSSLKTWAQKANATITSSNSMSIGPDGTVWILQGGSNNGVFKSINGGESFIKVYSLVNDSEGWPTKNLVIYSSILADPNDKDTVYFAGRDYGFFNKGIGVYVTRDGGNTWNALNDGLTHKQVNTMEIDSNTGAVFTGNGCHGIYRINTSSGDWQSTPTCSDLIQNQNEEGVDCGGPCVSCNDIFSTASSGGFIRVDPAYPHSFKYDNGTRFFPFGDTAYYLMAEEMGTIQQYIDSRAAKGFNFIRIFALGGYEDIGKYFWPFDGVPGNTNWVVQENKMQKLDAVFDYAKSKNMNIELLMWGYGRDGGNDMWGNTALENMWVDTLVNRYKNRTNLFMWTVTNEFERYPSHNDDYTFQWSDVDGMNRIVSRIKGIDNLHPVGVHGGATLGADEWGPLTVNQLWDDSDVDVYNVFLRSGHWNTAPWGTICPSGNPGVVYLDTYNNGELFSPTWDWGWSLDPLDIEDGVAADWNHAPARPYINTEFGYQFEDYLDASNGNYVTCQVFSPGTVRRTAWLTATSGGFLAAGFAWTAVDFTAAHINTWSPDQLVFLYDFFTKKTEYWKMAPHLELVDDKNSLLAIPGNEYVAYFPRGGRNYVTLQPGTYTVEKLDPKLMQYYTSTDITVNSNQQVMFDPPNGISNDWVLHLKIAQQITPTCYDGIQNQGETGVDCGGPCPACVICTSGQTQSCTTGNYGICSAGTRTCSNNVWGSCVQNQQATTEICGNDIDEDCDNVLNNGCQGVCDTDGDGHDEPLLWCIFGQPNDDCDDDNYLIHPGASETCGDGIDQDCSGADLVCPPASNKVMISLNLDNNVQDDSGNNNNAVNYGATFAPGKKNYAASFSGNGQHIKIPYTNSLPSGTISFWLKTNSAYNDFQIYIEGDGTEPNGYSSPGFEGTANQLKFYVNNVCELSSGILADTWVHVVGTWDGVQNKLYINGNPVSSGNCPYGETSFSRFSIAGRDAEYSFNGAMDEVKIYNYALGGDDVLTLYNSYSSPPSCSDGIRNQGETGVDCGGPCPACTVNTPPIVYITSPVSAGAGQCAQGIQTCSAEGQWGICTRSAVLTEFCNGIDDDCDGQIDEGFNIGQSCSVGTGACKRTGQIVCSGSSYSSCNVQPANPQAEVCGDGVDQDCNGADLLCDNTAPVISVYAPSSGIINQAFTITATATDIDGINRVEFYVQNSLISTDMSYPYSASYIPANVMSYNIFAKAFDNRGASSSSSSVSVNVVSLACENCDDNNPCTVDSCNAGVCSYSAGNSGIVCRASSGVCDVAETCTGSSTACPSDSFGSARENPSCGTCKYCSGASASCSNIASGSDPYNSCSGNCDVCNGLGSCVANNALCSGTSNSCGCSGTGSSFSCTVCSGSSYCSNGNCVGCVSNSECNDNNPCTVDSCFAGSCSNNPGNSGTVCRASVGVCDIAETCTGSSTSCPVDSFSSRDTVCRAAAGTCDRTEYCTGTSASCPSNVFFGRSDDVCGTCQYCTGSSATCSVVPSGSDYFNSCIGNCDSCNGAGACVGNNNLCSGNCDSCSGSGVNYNCAANNALCTGNCDSCSGSGTTFSCVANPSACMGGCSVCTGTDTSFSCAANPSACPGTNSECGCYYVSDRIYTCSLCSGSSYCSDGKCVGCVSHSECNDNDPCTVDTCNAGSCTNIPGNADVICRASTGACDIAETCTGVSKGCPVDRFQPQGTDCGRMCQSCNGVGSCINTPSGQDYQFECTPSFTSCSGSCQRSGSSDFCNGAGACGMQTANIASGNVCTGNGAQTILSCDNYCSASSTFCSAEKLVQNRYSCSGSGSCSTSASVQCIIDPVGCAECIYDIDCKLLPAPTCASSTVLRTYYGSCKGYSCTYPGTDITCSGSTPYCSGGRCVACLNDAQCNDNNICTVDSCNVGVCSSVPLTNEGVLCRASKGTCDAPEYCDGSSKNCPVDTYYGSTYNVCGTCQYCTGSSSSCTYVARGNDPLGSCLGNCDVCNGAGACVANEGLCTGNCDTCAKSVDGNFFNCAPNSALCSGTSSSCGCSGAGNAFSCTICSGGNVCNNGLCANPYQDT